MTPPTSLGAKLSLKLPTKSLSKKIRTVEFESLSTINDNLCHTFSATKLFNGIFAVYVKPSALLYPAWKKYCLATPTCRLDLAFNGWIVVDSGFIGGGSSGVVVLVVVVVVVGIESSELKRDKLLSS